MIARLALDGFGTSYSSVSLLKNFAVAGLKRLS